MRFIKVFPLLMQISKEMMTKFTGICTMDPDVNFLRDLFKYELVNHYIYHICVLFALQIRFVGELGNGKLGDIALDNMTITDGSCFLPATKPPRVISKKKSCKS